MNFVPKDFREIEKECYAWTMRSKDTTKEIKCNLIGIDVTIILQRMVIEKTGKISIPNKINVISSDPTIIEVFKKYLWQPSSYPNWDKRLWVFKNDPNISFPRVQYELQFFNNEDSFNDQPASNSNLCLII